MVEIHIKVTGECYLYTNDTKTLTATGLVQWRDTEKSFASEIRWGGWNLEKIKLDFNKQAVQLLLWLYVYSTLKRILFQLWTAHSPFIFTVLCDLLVLASLFQMSFLCAFRLIKPGCDSERHYNKESTASQLHMLREKKIKIMHIHN